MKLVILILVLLSIVGCKNTYITVATCNNGFTKESENLLIDKDTLIWNYPTAVYKIPDGVTCVITHRKLDNENNR
jgi:hypothetical protein